MLAWAAATGAVQPSVGLGMGLASDIAGIAGGLEAGGAKAFDPMSVSDFMSPFTQDVIDQSSQTFSVSQTLP